MGRLGRSAFTTLCAGIAAGSAIVWANRPGSRVANEVVAAAAAPSPALTTAAKRPTDPCDRAIWGGREMADDLMENRFVLARFPAVTLPTPLQWDEDPFGDPNWPYTLHTLRFPNALWGAWIETGDKRYRDRYEHFLRDWHEKNPRNAAPSRWSWADHSAAWRGIVYACALERLPGRPWLRDAAQLHGEVLADPAFYVRHGNHALNQSVGLFQLGCALDVDRWRATALERLDALAAESIDRQGVTNEQAIGYQWYNFRRYSQAVEAIRACGMRPPRSLERIDLMMEFLAFAALPNGRWEMIGDTLDDRLGRIRGSAAEYTATAGKEGSPPDSFAARFDAGFAFIRSGWGERRPFAEETALALRFGPGRRFHGHVDAAALTLYAFGDRILLDPGLYRYRHDPLRAWFKSGAAHNTIAVDGRPMRPQGATRMMAWQETPGGTYTAVTHRKIPGVSHTRRVFYSRLLDVVVVDDEVRGRRSAAVRQWWHLHPEARPEFSPDGFYTGRANHAANAWVVQLDGPVAHDVVRGSERPIQGWVSFDYATIVPAAAVHASKTGRHVRFLTLIVPARSSVRDWTVRSLERSADGFALIIERRGVLQSIDVHGRDATAL